MSNGTKTYATQDAEKRSYAGCDFDFTTVSIVKIEPAAGLVICVAVWCEAGSLLHPRLARVKIIHSNTDDYGLTERITHSLQPN